MLFPAHAGMTRKVVEMTNRRSRKEFLMTRKQRQIRIEAGDGTVQDYLHRIWARLFWTNAPAARLDRRCVGGTVMTRTC